jgi:hypothetical protein
VRRSLALDLIGVRAQTRRADGLAVVVIPQANPTVSPASGLSSRMIPPFGPQITASYWSFRYGIAIAQVESEVPFSENPTTWP